MENVQGGKRKGNHNETLSNILPQNKLTRNTTLILFLGWLASADFLTDKCDTYIYRANVVMHKYELRSGRKLIIANKLTSF